MLDQKDDPHHEAARNAARDFASDPESASFVAALTRTFADALTQTAREIVIQYQLGDDLLVTQDELACLLKCSTRQVERFVADGQLCPAKIGRTPVYSLGAVRAILKSAAEPSR